MSTMVSSPVSALLAHQPGSHCRRSAYGAADTHVPSPRRKELELRETASDAGSLPEVQKTDTVTLARSNSLPMTLENLKDAHHKKPGAQEPQPEDHGARLESPQENADEFVEIPLTPPGPERRMSSTPKQPAQKQSSQPKTPAAPGARSTIQLSAPPIEIEMRQLALPSVAPQAHAHSPAGISLVPPPTVIHQPGSNASQAQRRRAQNPAVDPASASCWEALNVFSHIKQYFTARSEAKAAEKQHKLETEALKQQRELRLKETFSSTRALYNKLFGQNANLVVKRDSIRNAEDEYLHSYNSYPITRREADLTAGGKDYHLTLEEMRPANHKRCTRHDYMHPHNPNQKEETPNPSFLAGTVIKAQLKGPNPEMFTFKRWPDPSVAFPDVHYVEESGKTHQRSYAYFKNSSEYRDIRRGDQFIQRDLLGKLQALFRPVVNPES